MKLKFVLFLPLMGAFYFPLSTVNAEQPIVAVFDVEVKGVKMDPGTLDRLTDYLCSLVAGKGFRVVPRSKLKESLLEKKKESYRRCYDQSCQIEIGQELAAQKSLSTQILSLGGKCKVTLTLYDLKRSTSEKAATVSGRCDEAQVVESLEKAAGQLVGVGSVASQVSSPQSATPVDKAGLIWVKSVPAGIEFTRSEITMTQYHICVGAGKCVPPHYDDGTCVNNAGKKLEEGKLPMSFRGSDQPVVCVDWNQATAFCSWVGGRLPTEEEWYAEASDTGKRKYPWGDTEVTCDTVVWGGGGTGPGCGKAATWPVCSREKGHSVSGLCDMSGNVWEWTSTSSQSTWVQRGGSWDDHDLDFLRASFRLGSGQTSNSVSFGFRCARSVGP